MLTVLAPDPAFGGGASAQTDAFVTAAREVGRDVQLAFVPHPALHGTKLTVDRIEAVRQLRGARRIAPTLREPLWVVTTLAPVGYAAALSGLPYACWIGTTIDDEWAGRRPGLSAARRSAFAASLPVLRSMERRVLIGATKVFATSRGSREAIARATGRTAEVLPIPVDVERLTPEPDDAWLARLDAPVLAFVGRAWDPRKNIALLLDALPLIRARIPRARVLLIGEPPRGPLPDGVEATGPVDDIGAALRTASLFVLPSHQEGFGIVAAEALACGVPVVSTRSGGPEGLIESSGGAE